jgi:hypothetical protein
LDLHIPKNSGIPTKTLSLLADASLGRFQRIQLESLRLNLLLHMGGEVAGSLGPLDRRVTVTLAVRPCFENLNPLASFTGGDDRIAFTAIVATTIFLHKDTLCSRLNRLANHGTPLRRNG